METGKMARRQPHKERRKSKPRERHVQQPGGSTPHPGAQAGFGEWGRGREGVV